MFSQRLLGVVVVNLGTVLVGRLLVTRALG